MFEIPSVTPCVANAFSRSYQWMDHYEWSLTWKLMDQSVLYWPFCVAQTRTTVWYWIVNFPYFSDFLAYDLTEFMWFPCFLAESEGGVLIFECKQEYTNDPNGFRSLLGKRTIQHTLVHQLSGKDEVFHGLLSNRASQIFGIFGHTVFCVLLNERKLMRPSLGRLEVIFDGGQASKADQSRGWFL